MSPFVFRLEKVRRMRQSMEDRAREELATSLAAKRESEAALGAADTRVHGALDMHRRIAHLSGASAADLIAAQAYLERLETERSVANRVLDCHEESVHERRSALASAAREREVLDRLRHRRETAHRVEANRVEANALDELALRGHQRGKAA
jgi:flagellar FliJ protein